MIVFEARFPGREGGEAPRERDGAGHEQHGHGQFDGNEDGAEPGAAGRCGPSALAECLGEIHSRRAQRWREADDERGEHGECRGERKDACIHRNVRDARDACRRQGTEGSHRAEGDDDARNRAAAGEHETLDEERAHDSAGPGAERGPRRHLPAAHLTAREKEVAHVRAGDEQHEYDGGEKEHEARAHVANHEVAERQHGQAPAARGREVLAPDGVGDGREFRARLGHRHAGLEAAIRHEAAPVAVLFVARVHVHGAPEFDVLELRQVEPALENADDADRVVVEHDDAPDNAGVAVEPRLPHLPREECDIALTAQEVGRGNEPSAHDADAERGEQPGRRDAALHGLRTVRRGEMAGPCATDANRLERAATGRRCPRHSAARCCTSHGALRGTARRA